MKKLFYLIVVIFSFVACNEETDSENNSESFDANDVEAKTMNALKTLNDEPNSELLKYYLSLEEFRSLAENEDVFITDDGRNHASSFSKDDYQKLGDKLIRVLVNVRRDGAKFNIDWSKIEFYDYTYIRSNDDGFRDAKIGKLQFTFNEKQYEVKVKSIENNDKNYIYKILNLKPLYEIAPSKDITTNGRLDVSIYDSESVLFRSRSSGNAGNIEIMELITANGTWYYHTAHGEAEGIKLGSRTVNGIDAVYFYKSPNTNYTMVFSKCGYSLTNQKTGEEQWYEQISPECK